MGPGAGSPFKPTGNTPSIWDILTYGKERAGQAMAAAKENSSPVAQPIPVVVPEAAPAQAQIGRAHV